MNQPSPVFADKHAVSNLLGVRPGTLKNWRLGRPGAGIAPVLIEGIHWVRQSSRHTLYNVDLLRDFIATRENPDVHELAISNYLASLPSSNAAALKSGRSRQKNAA